MRRSISLAAIMVTVLLWSSALVLAAAPGSAPKAGGVLNAMQGEDPAGFSIHETGTILALWPAMPCFSNLVLFDPFKPEESADTILPELAERWSWQDGYRNLVFFLRKNVRWHDGQPFTARDVKYTFDVVREARDAPAKLRLSPRKDWFANVEAIEVVDPYTVIFRLRRPQPSLIMMLASGYSPVYPAHVPIATFRTKCVGTGPFRLKQYLPGQVVEYERNPDYFVKGRPYLDGLRYPVIAERGTRMAALQAGRLDVSFPSEMTKIMAETMKRNVPSLVVNEISQNASDNVILNIKRPPFDNLTVRRAVSLALDRRAYVVAVRHGGALVGAGMAPKPWGVWGLSGKDLAALPEYGDPAGAKAAARKLLASAGYGPGKPLKLEMLTRSWAVSADLASFVVDQLRQVGVDATMRQMESAEWFPLLARRDYLIGANLTGTGIDDPDAILYENYKCGSSRNYTEYCNPEVDRLIETQSQELDRTKRARLVLEIQRKLEADVARPMLGWRADYFIQWPYVKNLVPHHSLYNYARMQEVWLDR
jgi:peptide/nickel transport system substrate-binding protein